MKLQKRGKYAVVKLHLDAKECEAILCYKPDILIPIWVQKAMSRLIRKALKKDPTILDPRTDTEIQAALEKEHLKASQRLDDIEGYIGGMEK